MQSRLAFVLAGALVVLLLSLALRSLGRDARPAVSSERPVASPDAVAAPGDAAQPPRDLERSALAEALQAEVEARRKLAGEVERLRQEVARLGALSGIAAAQTEPTGERPDDDEEVEPEALPLHPTGFFDEELLVAQGVGAAEAARLRETFDEHELERLYLGDQAAREGWLYTPRFRREIQALVEETRAALGDVSFDQMLYAAGRNNRVLVTDLLSRSPASQAGLEPGDIVLSYGGQPIFSAVELQAATQQGEAGTPTRIEVLRDDRVVTFRVPRGPLGVRLLPTRHPPRL
ncbi:MAG: PDZ domain-containing protein [Deltaproteobacteria bacterium]|nr:MAG: PDZ domain-containing protein [Deltaproteobacteria bacterium]